MTTRNISSKTDFVYKNVGYGLTSFEPGNDFIEVRDGRLVTHTFSKPGMEWDDRRECWKFDSGLGLVAYLVLRSELTEEQVAEFERDFPDEKEASQ